MSSAFDQFSDKLFIHKQGAHYQSLSYTQSHQVCILDFLHMKNGESDHEAPTRWGIKGEDRSAQPHPRKWRLFAGFKPLTSKSTQQLDTMARFGEGMFFKPLGSPLSGNFSTETILCCSLGERVVTNCPKNQLKGRVALVLFQPYSQHNTLHMKQFTKEHRAP